MEFQRLNFLSALSRETSVNCYFSIKIFVFFKSNSFQFEGDTSKQLPRAVLIMQLKSELVALNLFLWDS